MAQLQVTVSIFVSAIMAHLQATVSMLASAIDHPVTRYTLRLGLMIRLGALLIFIYISLHYKVQSQYLRLPLMARYLCLPLMTQLQATATFIASLQATVSIRVSAVNHLVTSYSLDTCLCR